MQDASPEVLAVRARGYLDFLEPFTGIVVEKACAIWMKGEANTILGRPANYSFAASTPELVILCRSVVADIDDRINRLDEVLHAIVEIPPPRKSAEERAAFIDRLQAIHGKDWGLGTPTDGRKVSTLRFNRDTPRVS